MRLLEEEEEGETCGGRPVAGIPPRPHRQTALRRLLRPPRDVPWKMRRWEDGRHHPACLAEERRAAARAMMEAKDHGRRTTDEGIVWGNGQRTETVAGRLLRLETGAKLAWLAECRTYVVHCRPRSSTSSLHDATVCSAQRFRPLFVGGSSHLRLGAPIARETRFSLSY